MSKYNKVYLDIKEKIKNKVINSGEYLKSELELSKEYNYSKDTIRKALNLLELDGLIRKIKGKNSIVLDNKYNHLSLATIKTNKELNKLGNLDIKTKLISLYIIQGDTKVMEAFGANKKDDFYRVIRTRTINGETIEYDDLFFDRKIITYLDEDVPKNSLYEYFEKTLKLKISHSRREIKFRYATEEEKLHMDLNGYDMVVEMECFTYLSNGSLFQYGKTTYRPDKFTFLAIAKR